MKSKISFIIICFNAEDTLRRCIRSVISIDVSLEYEIIIVNDGSVDNTLRIAIELENQHNNIIVLDNHGNKGRAHSRNNGIHAASGDYIFFLDADDFIFPSNIDSVLPLMDLEPDIVVCGRMDFSLENNRFFTWGPSQYIFPSILHFEYARVYPECINDNFVTGKFYKTEFLYSHKIRFSDIRKNAEDIMFSTSTWINAHNIYFSGAPFYIYGRGNYKAKFGLEKCEDVLYNIQELLRLSAARYHKNEKLMLKSKYANTLRETIRRSRGKVKENDLIRLLKTYYINIESYEDLLYVKTDTIEIIRLCNSGDFEFAIDKCNT